jgi:tripartite ATP-independent transporter DctM subunit
MLVYWVVLSFVIMSLLLLLKVPVAVSIGSATIFLTFLTGPLSGWEKILSLKMVYGVNSFTILSIPLFVWIGQLINHEVVAKPLFSVTRQAVGWWRGGLLQFNMIFSGAFSALSGSAVADAAGPSRAIYYVSVDAGYDKETSAAATAVSSVLSVIIPPSIPLILWGFGADVSIGRLWAGSIIPGIFLLGGFMIVTAILARRRNYPREKFPGLSSFLSNIYASFPVLLAPLILWGGVFGGIFTPTEAAAVVVAYLIFISSIIYKVSLREHVRMMIDTIRNSAAILFIVAVANYFSWLMAYKNIPANLVEWILGLTSNTQTIFLLIVFVLLILGCFMDLTALILMVAPVMTVVASRTGIDPVQLGVVGTLTLSYGLLTPPFGLLLFVVQRVTGVDYIEIVKSILPYYIVLFLVLLIIIFFPQTVTYLPNLFYGK